MKFTHNHLGPLAISVGGFSMLKSENFCLVTKECLGEGYFRLKVQVLYVLIIESNINIIV